MRIVVALGGNALAKRGEPITVERQRANVAIACAGLAPVAASHELVITHGNGPQVGMLALQSASYDVKLAYPFDVMDAQTEGMIGYFIEQELGNLLPDDRRLATLLTQIQVSPDDPAFANPTKFVGPTYDRATAEGLARDNGWVVKADGDAWRRVVPSPSPVRIFEINPIRWLLEKQVVVVCAGGGGIPTMYEPGTRHLVGVEAVIDKDLASSVLARDLDADLLVIATDVPAVIDGWGTDHAREIRRASPDDLDALDLPAGSMGPKVTAATGFVRETNARAAIGALADIEGLIDGTRGTQVSPDAEEIVTA
jgi:carbamate kinase